MNLITEPYEQALSHWPTSGQHILSHQQGGKLVVYQAFNSSITEYAVEHQRFGGPHYKMGRMTWIKPNFLWMMYRAGWATKPNQERILALWIPTKAFEEILAEAVHSSFKPSVYANHETWKAALAQSGVRLQWDPDHNPYGAKQERRAIQIGLKGHMLHHFHSQITQIEDVTDFVQAQHAHVRAKDLASLKVPVERAYHPQNASLITSLQLDTLAL